MGYLEGYTKGVTLHPIQKKNHFIPYIIDYNFDIRKHRVYVVHFFL